MRITKFQATAFVSLFPTIFHSISAAELFSRYNFLSVLASTFSECAQAIKTAKETWQQGIPLETLKELVIASCGTPEEFKQDVKDYSNIPDQLYLSAVIASSFFAAAFLLMILTETFYRRNFHHRGPALLILSPIFFAMVTVSLWVMHFYFSNCIATATCNVNPDYDEPRLARASSVINDIANTELVMRSGHLVGASVSFVHACFNLGKHWCYRAAAPQTLEVNPGSEDESDDASLVQAPPQLSVFERAGNCFR